ncbi:hypothetical protein [Olivibacter sitiensis]|uniref:hypothetical protein n=1 Tax=Olivibacter sitiensis TaxID=376470 RepID=UPI000684E877|nr:hypothetical protein [Olivibacter sitiensis]
MKQQSLKEIFHQLLVTPNYADKESIDSLIDVFPYSRALWFVKAKMEVSSPEIYPQQTTALTRAALLAGDSDVLAQYLYTGTTPALEPNTATSENSSSLIDNRITDAEEQVAASVDENETTALSELPTEEETSTPLVTDASLTANEQPAYETEAGENESPQQEEETLYDQNAAIVDKQENEEAIGSDYIENSEISQEDAAPEEIIAADEQEILETHYSNEHSSAEQEDEKEASTIPQREELEDPSINELPPEGEFETDIIETASASVVEPEKEQSAETTLSIDEEEQEEVNSSNYIENSEISQEGAAPEEIIATDEQEILETHYSNEHSSAEQEDEKEASIIPQSQELEDPSVNELPREGEFETDIIETASVPDEAPVVEPEKEQSTETNLSPAVGKEEKEEVSRYDDEHMPYSFLWWLHKTRIDYADTYQPYNVHDSRLSKTKKPAGNDIDTLLDQQIKQHIFNLQAPEKKLSIQDTGKEERTFHFASKTDDIIDRFIKEEPQITPPRADKITLENKARKSAEDESEFVSETLATIYIQQGLYHKAEETYSKLSLKYPEKSAYFADRIEDLRKRK